MRRAGAKIISVCCAILLLPGLTCACRKKKAKTTDDAAVAEKQIRNTVDDYFAYIKIAKTDKINSLCEDESYSDDRIRSITSKVGAKVFEAACRRVSAQILSITPAEDEGIVKVKLTYCDPDYVTEKAGPDGYKDSTRLAEHIDSAPSASKELSLVLRCKEGPWKIVAKSVGDIFTTAFGFLEKDGLIASPKETITSAPDMSMSVFDAYWVDPKGEETSGYHCSEAAVCLYVYTWNTYSNAEITYEYYDTAWNLVYTNTFLMKNNTDWIACAWNPNKMIPEGNLYCRLYDPNGDEFLTTMTHIYPNGEILPFAITFTDDGYWADGSGLPVDIYPAETQIMEYHTKSLKFYKDLDLVYKFVDDEGNVLYENTMQVKDLTDTFVFTWNREGLEPLLQEPSETEETGTSSASETSDPTETTLPPEPKFITLEVTTSGGQMFLITQIEIQSPVEATAPSVSEPQETQS